VSSIDNALELAAAISEYGWEITRSG